MTNNGPHIDNSGLDRLGLNNLGTVHWNLEVPRMYQEAIERKEGVIAKDGPFVVETGQHTGRSAKDKFFAREAEHEANIAWGDVNKAISEEHFDTLYKRIQGYLQGHDIFVQDMWGGADDTHRLPVRIITEYAWHSLFIRQLLIEPEASERAGFDPEFTIIDVPGFEADPEIDGCRSETVIAISFKRKLVLIGGTSYAGEIKKSVFSILNYLLPEKGVMPMHCSVNVGDDDDAAIFFGLSGTGKTTLSADPNRILVGDDEHGWSENGIFNFEGGCYAKMIKLSAEAEPEIYATTKQFGTVLENVVMDPDTGELDLDDDSLTENTRGAYPLSAIPNASTTGKAPHPKNIIMLTADAFGVMPPISKLTPEQAMYHFLSGYTAKVAGTEKGVIEPEATFSTCFGAPFMPRQPTEYGDLLKKLIAEHDVKCWLVNTGWTGGAYGTGKRMPIKHTRALLSAALDGSLNEVKMRLDPNFGFMVPTSLEGVPAKILDPRQTWKDGAAYDAQAQMLVGLFIDNFGQYEGHVSAEVKAAAPHAA